MRGLRGFRGSGAGHANATPPNPIADKTRGGILIFTGSAGETNTAITVADTTIERTGTFTNRYGVEISRSSGVTVRNNLILASGHDGIGFTTRSRTVRSSHTTITQNTIAGSGGSGNG